MKEIKRTNYLHIGFRMNENILNFERRRKIYNFVKENPGLYLREISRRLDIPKTTLEYHLNWLKKLDLIVGRNDGRCILYFVSNSVSTQDKEIIKLLRNKTACQIILYFIYNISCSIKELSGELNISASTAHRYIKKMLNSGLIEEAPVDNGQIYIFPEGKKSDFVLLHDIVGREIFYRRKSHRVIKRIYALLIMHKHSLDEEEIIDALVDYVDEVSGSIKETKSKKLLGCECHINNVIDFTYEMFKIPFCA